MERLKEELTTFERLRPRLLKEHEGRFVVIHRSSILGIYDSSEEAFAAAMTAYGIREVFLLRQLCRQPEQAEAPALRLGLLALRGL